MSECVCVYLEEDEPKSRGYSKQEKYGSGDTSTKFNHKENKCLERKRKRERERNFNEQEEIII